MSPFYLSVHRILLNDPDLKVIVDLQSGPRSLIQLGADIHRHLSSRSDSLKNNITFSVLPRYRLDATVPLVSTIILCIIILS